MTQQQSTKTAKRYRVVKEGTSVALPDGGMLTVPTIGGGGSSGVNSGTFGPTKRGGNWTIVDTRPGTENDAEIVASYGRGHISRLWALAQAGLANGRDEEALRNGETAGVAPEVVRKMLGDAALSEQLSARWPATIYDPSGLEQRLRAEAEKTLVGAGR